MFGLVVVGYMCVWFEPFLLFGILRVLLVCICLPVLFDRLTCRGTAHTKHARNILVVAFMEGGNRTTATRIAEHLVHTHHRTSHNPHTRPHMHLHTHTRLCSLHTHLHMCAALHPSHIPTPLSLLYRYLMVCVCSLPPQTPE